HSRRQSWRQSGCRSPSWLLAQRFVASFPIIASRAMIDTRFDRRSGSVASPQRMPHFQPISSAMRTPFIAAFLLVAATAATAQQPVPEIPFDASVDFLKLPAGMYFGDVAGVAIDARRHLYVFSRTGSRSTVHGATASQLFEFGPDGAFIREIGKDLYGFAFAHTVRIDADGNLWATDEGTNMIIKFNPAGRVLMVLGRRPEAVEESATPTRPGWGTFNRPTDVAWDRDGNIFIADGYNNSRVVKVDRHG